MTYPSVVALLCFGFTALPVRSGKDPGAPPKAVPVPRVQVSRPVQREVTDFADFTGRTEAVSTVELRARVTGYLTRVHFKDGAEVRQGELLFEIDPRPYRAELEEAEAAVAVSKARLKRVEAEYKRMAALLARGPVSREDVDRVAAEKAEAEAAVRIPQARLEAARLKLEFTRVVAPVSGHIGRRFLDVGNLVKGDETKLATIVSEDPIYIYFGLDEATLLRVRRAVNAGRLKLPEVGQIPVWMGLASEQGYPHRGAVDFVNNQVNPDNGSNTVRGVFPNPLPPGGTRLLSPGMFVRIRLAVGAPHAALLVTDGALRSDPAGKYVYVVDAQDRVQKRAVVTGALQGEGLREITQGLRAEDSVIVSGRQNFRVGQAVRPEVVPMPGQSRKAPP